MNRIRGKLALVTGASAGFGEACARQLASSGVDLVLWARRLDRLQSLRNEIVESDGVVVRVDAVDVRDRDEIARVAGDVFSGGKVPDIIVNNAGLASGLDKFHEGDFEDWDKMIDTNVKGVLNVARSFLPAMVKRGTGHIVNIGSIAGHMVYPKGAVYNATKFAVRALSEGMNLDLAGTSIRVSSVDPGAAETEFSEVRFHGDKDRAKTVYEGFEPLVADDIADAVLYVLNTPQHVNVTDLVIMPTAQRNPYVLHRSGM
jgi:3-hydroxy acid dehydrogenase/malonic semialdehyde reductase